MEFAQAKNSEMSNAGNGSFFEEDKKDRWSSIDFGLVHSLFSVILVNASNRVCGALTILTTIIISISDAISDLVIAATLFARKHTSLGWVVILIDYIPSWTLAFHNLCSSKWRAAETFKQKIFTIVCLIFSPFASTLFQLKWLYCFEKVNQTEFEVLHHNSRLSQLLSGSYESPMQIILLLILWAQNKLEVPWSIETCVTDSQHRLVCLGIIPGILSLTISMLSILKGSIDVSEGRTWREKGITFVYALSNYAFRLPSIALAILYFNEWSVFLFVPIIFMNLVIFLRFDEAKRKNLSVVTSVIIATISPFVSSDEANLYQTKDVSTTLTLDDSKNNYRRNLAAKLSMVISSMLFASNLILLVLLKYDNEFTYNKDIILEKHTAENILSIFLLPLWAFVMLCCFFYGRKSHSKNTTQENGSLKKKLRFYLPIAGAVAILFAVTVLFGVLITHIDTKGMLQNKNIHF